MMNSRAAVDRWADKHGFGKAQKFQAINTKIGGSTAARQAGFYLLICEEDSYYIGESVNLRARMGQHNAQWGDEINEVRILRRNLSKPALRKEEKKLIREFNKQFPNRCRNIVHGAQSFGKDELAELVSPEEQEQWLADPAGFNGADQAVLKPMIESQVVKNITKARKLDQDPDVEAIAEVLHTYLENCVPAPRRTEFQGWSVSSGTFNGRRTFCVSVGKMEVFVLGANLGGFIVGRESVLFDPVYRQPRRGWFSRGPELQMDVYRTDYEDAGGDCVSIDFDDLDHLRQLLDEPSVRAAAARLNLDIMRKHSCVYTQYHCPQLVERAYAGIQRDAPEPDVVSDNGAAPSDVPDSALPQAEKAAPGVLRPEKVQLALGTFIPWAIRVAGGVEVLDELPAKAAREQVAAVIADVVDHEGPIHVDRLVRLTAQAFGLQRVAASRETALLNQIRAAGLAVDADGFVWPEHWSRDEWRGFRKGSADDDRLFQHISPVELANAGRSIRSRQPGISDDALEVEILRVFGKSRRTDQVRKHLAVALRHIDE